MITFKRVQAGSYEIIKNGSKIGVIYFWGAENGYSAKWIISIELEPWFFTEIDPCGTLKDAKATVIKLLA